MIQQMLRKLVFWPAMAALLAACTPTAAVREPPTPTVPAQTTAGVPAAEIGATGASPTSPSVVEDSLLPPSAPEAIFFGRASVDLQEAEAQKLVRVAERLRHQPELVVTLVGHTDHLGSRALNLAIAEQRTAAVMRRLRELGVPAKQIRRRSHGNEAADTCRSESCRARMRRVDLVYLKQRR